MATYVKGNAVPNATSYELFEKIEPNTGELADYENPSDVPAGYWAWDDENKFWRMNESAASGNIKWNVNLEAGVTYVFQYKIEEVSSGGVIGNVRRLSDNKNVATVVCTDEKTGTTVVGVARTEYTPETSGEYQFRIAGNAAPCTSAISSVSIRPAGMGDGEETTYISKATAGEINFDVSETVADGNNHTFVVKAKADGYEDSDYSNEVVYTAT